jgi:hypothetical protein
VGEDWRFEAEDLVGQALVAEGVCVHLSAFPNEARDGRGLGSKNVIVINDEAHHCYRRRAGGEEEKLTGDDRKGIWN